MEDLLSSELLIASLVRSNEARQRPVLAQVMKMRILREISVIAIFFGLPANVQTITNSRANLLSYVLDHGLENDLSEAYRSLGDSDYKQSAWSETQRLRNFVSAASYLLQFWQPIEPGAEARLLGSPLIGLNKEMVALFEYGQLTIAEVLNHRAAVIVLPSLNA